MGKIIKTKNKVEKVERSTALYIREDYKEILENGKTNLEVQEEVLRNYCKEKGYRVVAVYTDHNTKKDYGFWVNEYMFPRGDFDQLIDDYNNDSNKKWNRVLVTDLDRISDDPQVLASMLCLMTSHESCDGNIVESVKEGIFKKDFDLGIVFKEGRTEDTVRVEYSEFVD